jgi:hypothetical protein
MKCQVSSRPASANLGEAFLQEILAEILDGAGGA